MRSKLKNQILTFENNPGMFFDKKNIISGLVLRKHKTG